MTNKSFVEDMMTLATGALSQLAESRHEVKAQMRGRAGSVARSLDLVTREEFDAAFAMMAKARNSQEDIIARLIRIESHLGIGAKTAKKAPASAAKTKKTRLPSVKTKTLATRKK